MQTQSTVKSLGKLLIGLGIFITLVLGLGVVVTILILFFAKLKDNEVATAFVVLVMCGALTSAGLVAVFGGIRQAKTGRTSKAVMWFYLGLVVLFLILYYGVFSFLKG